MFSIFIFLFEGGVIMKIAYILPSLDSKAPIFVAKLLAEFFVGQGNEVAVFYFDDICEVAFPCETRRINFGDKIPFDEFDIIHSHMRRPDLYLARNARNIRRAKMVSTVHCDIKNDLAISYGRFVSAIFSRQWIRALKKFDATVQINDFLMKVYAQFKNNALIYNGVKIDLHETGRHREICGKMLAFKSAGLKTICSFSVIVKRKGLLQVLRLLEKDGRFAYVCIGSGNYKAELERFVSEKKLQSRVAFFDAVERPYVVLKDADIFCFPSYSEGFSLALLESGLVGASVVCSDIPAFKVFSENEISFFSLDDTDSLRRACEAAIEKRGEKLAALKKRIGRDFSQEKMLLEYQALYKDLTKKYMEDKK